MLLLGDRKDEGCETQIGYSGNQNKRTRPLFSCIADVITDAIQVLEHEPS